MPDPSDILPVDRLKADPGFMGLPYATKQAAVSRMLQQDPGFASLDAATQAKAASKTINVHALGVLPPETPIKDAAKGALDSAASSVSLFDPNLSAGQNAMADLNKAKNAVLPTLGMLTADPAMAAAGLEEGAVPAGMEAAGAAGTVAPQLAGAAAGAEGANLADQASGQKPAPQNLSDAVSQAVNDFAQGAAMMVGDRVGKDATDKLGVSDVTPRSAAGELADKANAQGIRLRPDQLSNNKFVAWVTGVLQKYPGTAGIMAKADASTATALNKVSTGILDDLGAVASKTEQGATLQQNVVEAAGSRLQAVKNNLYKIAEADAPKVADVYKNNYIALAQGMQDKIAQLPANAQDQTLNSFLDGVTAPFKESEAAPGRGVKVDTQPLTPQGYVMLKQAINDLSRPAQGAPMNATQHAYMQLGDALDQDFAEFAARQGGTFADKVQAANAANGAYKELTTNPFYKSLVKSNPEAVIDKMMVPGNITNMQVLKAAVPPADWEKYVEPSIVTKLFSTPKLEPSDLADAGPAVPADTFRKNMKLYPRAQLESVLQPGTLSRLENFDEIMNAVKRSPDVISGNASGTSSATTGSVLGPTAGAMLVIRHPILGTSVMLSSPLLAKMWLSKTGQDIITEGLSPILKGTAVAASRSAGVLTALKLMEKVAGPAAAQQQSQPPAPPSPTSAGSAQGSPMPAATPPLPQLGPQAMGERTQVKSFLNGDEQGALDAAQSTYAKFPQSMASRRMIERIYQKRGDIEGMKKALGEK